MATTELTILENDNIKNKIYNIRGLQVMLDRDLADLYEVETKYLKRQVKRNILKFPSDFMFELTREENEALNLRCQNVTSNWGGVRYLPFVFTEQGVSMLSSILSSQRAIKISIQIMRAFIDMRKFLNANALVFQRMDRIEKKQIESDAKFEQIFNALANKENIPKHGIFFDGQVFDAYKFVSDLIRKAKKSIIIIDNFVDDRVFAILAKRQKNVKVTIFTKNITKELLVDLKKYNSQYPEIKIKEFKKSHDRFLILDETDVYLIGSSLKDLGTKWFGFSKIEIESFNIIEKLKSLVDLKS